MRFLRISVGLTRTDTVRLCKKRIVFTFIVFLSVFSNRDIMLTITVKSTAHNSLESEPAPEAARHFLHQVGLDGVGHHFQTSSCVILVSLDAY